MLLVSVLELGFSFKFQYKQNNQFQDFILINRTEALND